MKHTITEFESREAASDAAALRIVQGLRRTLARSSEALVAVSGGSTPIATFERLALQALPWHRVWVTLTDERRVPPTHRDSNTGMLRRNLLRDKAALARLHNIGTPLPTKAKFALALVGMGADGHFASIFPDMENLEEALKLDSCAPTLPVNTMASEHPRITMTLSALLGADEIVVVAFGEEKRRVLTGTTLLPIHHLLQAQRTPVDVLWAS